MLSDEADIVLVLGSQNSSNSQRLAELARDGGIAAPPEGVLVEVDVSFGVHFHARVHPWRRAGPWDARSIRR